MLYLHILLKRRVALRRAVVARWECLRGFSTLTPVQIKTRFEGPLICVRDAWLEIKVPILLRYLQRYWLKSTIWANAGRLLFSFHAPFTSSLPAWRLPLPLVVRCATVQWVAWDSPACLTNAVAPRQCCCSPQTLCQWHHSCQSCHSPKQSQQLALSKRAREKASRKREEP